MKYTPVIGLEVHIEPNTKTKMFCGCPQDHFGKKPNSQTCPICLGLPGALPFANYEAILKTVKLGLSLGSSVNKYSNFYRKHYFYPDLPKSFQTSQKDSPLCMGGELFGKRINHIHLEEDAGKLLHETIGGEKVSLVDFNRSGCALIELVTEADFRSVQEVLTFTKELQMIARYLDISGADMEKGTMRLEANVSLTKDDPNTMDFKLPDYKVELKNINSFRFLANAIQAEIERQEDVLEKGEKLIQETRGYDEVKKTTYSQRSKEGSQDYRYFPEADLPPIKLRDEQIEEIRNTIPELPENKRKRFSEDYSIPQNYLTILVEDKEKAELYDKAFDLAKREGLEPKIVADLIVNRGLKAKDPKEFIQRAKEKTQKSFAEKDETEKAVLAALEENSKPVEDYKKGKTQVIGFLIGMVQKKLSGRGDPKEVAEILLKKLK